MERSPPYQELVTRADLPSESDGVRSEASYDLNFSRERLIPESQLKEIVAYLVKQILAEMLGVNTTANSVRQWYDTDPAYFHLGLDSSEQLRIMVREGTLRVGNEVRDIRQRNSLIPRYQFHIAKCEARLSSLPEKRKGKKTGQKNY